MDNTNEKIYFQLRTKAEEIFPQLRNLDVRTYTLADLAGYTAKNKNGTDWKSKSPEAIRFRNALDKWCKDNEYPIIKTEYGTFSCEVDAKYLFNVLYEFEKLAEILKDGRAKFTYSDTTDATQVAYLTMVLPKNAAQTAKCIGNDDNHPSMKYVWIDTEIKWMWCTETHVLYAHPINGKLHNVHEDWKEFKQWPITVEMAKKYAGQAVCVQYFDNGTIICRKVNYDEVTAKVEHLNSLMKRVPAWRRVIPDIDPATRIVLDMDHFDKFKKFLTIHKKSDRIGLEVQPSGLYLHMAEFTEFGEIGNTQQVAIEGINEHHLKGIYSTPHMTTISKDMNGVMYHGGNSRAMIIESKDNDGFYLLMTHSYHKEYFENYTETHKPNINYMATKVTETPMMKAYQEMKAKHPDAIILFRVGDFYETFSEDAVACSEILDITLTRRYNGGEVYALAGFPHHALDLYLPKLVRAGKRVAICEALDDTAKTIEQIDPEPIADPTPEPEPAVVEPEPVADPEPVAQTIVDPNPPTKQELMKAGLYATASMQIKDTMSIVASEFKPIGDDNGKLLLIIKDKTIDKFYYADIVVAAQFLYICSERQFDTAEEVAKMIGIDLGQPKPIPEPEPEPEPTKDMTLDELTEMFRVDYGMDDVAAEMQAAKVAALVKGFRTHKSVAFSFEKKDGTIRDAHGTLLPEFLPASKGGKPLDKKLQLYYDLDKQALRSFEKSKLMSFLIKG